MLATNKRRNKKWWEIEIWSFHAKAHIYTIYLHLQQIYIYIFYCYWAVFFFSLLCVLKIARRGVFPAIYRWKCIRFAGDRAHAHRSFCKHNIFFRFSCFCFFCCFFCSFCFAARMHANSSEMQFWCPTGPNFPHGIWSEPVESNQLIDCGQFETLHLRSAVNVSMREETDERINGK